MYNVASCWLYLKEYPAICAGVNDFGKSSVIL